MTKALRLPSHPRFSLDAHFDADDVISLRFAGAQGSFSRADVISLWQHDGDFREFFSDVLAHVPFEAFHWETPTLRSENLSRPFECVVIASRALAMIAADPQPFAEHIASGVGSCDVVAFANISGDARLIVPCASGPNAKFARLASFLRTAPPQQVHRLWQAVSTDLEGVIAAKRWPQVWLSTAGLASAGCMCGSIAGPNIIAMSPTERRDRLSFTYGALPV